MSFAYYIIPVFFSLILIIGIKKNSFDSFIKGAKNGIEIALDTFPYLLTMVLATKLLTSSMILIYLFKKFDIPYLLFVEGVFRPLSSNASLSILIEIYSLYGVDSNYGVAASVLQGATETSFYIIAVYYGAIGIKKYRYSLVMGLIANLIIFILSLILFYFLI